MCKSARWYAFTKYSEVSRRGLVRNLNALRRAVFAPLAYWGDAKDSQNLYPEIDIHGRKSTVHDVEDQKPNGEVQQ